jgi:streptogramin lyase
VKGRPSSSQSANACCHVLSPSRSGDNRTPASGREERSPFVAGFFPRFSAPSRGRAGSDPVDITAGPDGNVWFAVSTTNRIGRITPDGVFSLYVVPTSGSVPATVAPGSDGNVWFVELSGSKIGRITPGGVITEYPLPAGKDAPKGISAGLGGDLWFTARASGTTGVMGCAITP